MKRLLLVGAGHAHAQVLRHWARQPVPGCQLVVLTPTPLAPYSGMVPGWLAGHYRFEQICIDFAALARAAGAQLQLGEAVALDAARQTVTLASGEQLGYDALSLNIGSTLRPPIDLGPAPLLALRPLSHLHQAWQALLQTPRLASDPRPLRITAVGGGAAGVECLLAAMARLRGINPQRAVQGRLVSRSPQLLPGLAPGAVRAMTRLLAEQRVDLQLGTTMTADLGADLGSEGDLLLWATGAQAHAWPAASGLACSGDGFVHIDTQLRSTSHPQVWAVGDCAAWAPPLPKAGVYAVRMGPVLAHNLHAAMAGVGTAMAYQPQRRFLALLATGDQRAVASWGPLSASGAWVWCWKDRIDRGFLAGFDDLQKTG